MLFGGYVVIGMKIYAFLHNKISNLTRKFPVHVVCSRKECANRLKEAKLSLEISQGEVEEDSFQAKKVKAAKDAHDNAKEAVLSVAVQEFSVYFNLFLEEARQPGKQILAEQLTSHCKLKTPLHFPYTREWTECKVGIQEI